MTKIECELDTCEHYSINGCLNGDVVEIRRCHKMTKEKFEDGYISRSKVTKEFYDRHFVTVPCNCGEDVCDGWAVKHHEEEET